MGTTPLKGPKTCLMPGARSEYCPTASRRPTRSRLLRSSQPRTLTLGYLADRYRAKATADNASPEKWVFVRTDGNGLPLWDSGVRQALKRAAAAEGCDFPGLGPHSFRRANTTWRQEVGGSSIEALKIAGHSTVRMTEEYTKIQLTRQEELTRLIQERLAGVGGKQSAVVQ